MNLIGCLLTLAVSQSVEYDLLRYTGTLTQVPRMDEPVVVKRFSVLVLAEKSGQVGFIVEERGGGGWPWPERFDQISYQDGIAPEGSHRPRLLYLHNEVPVVVRLPLPIFNDWKNLSLGKSWVDENSKERFQVAEKESNYKERNCFVIEISSNFGRRRSLWVETKTGHLVGLEERLFMGQGDEFTLKLGLEESQKLAEAESAATQEIWEHLLAIKRELKRGEDASDPVLTKEQLELTTKMLEELDPQATESPLGRFVSAIGRDVKQQLQRTSDIAQLAQKYVGKKVELPELQLIDKKTIAAEKHEGRIVVLHFWEYKDEPLSEPYGQVGYLDYLHNRRRKLGVDTYGVAVDSRFAKDNEAVAAYRAAGKLKEFMNLSYPIAVDSGELINTFGDPRKVNARLPLWVVIDTEGKIAHYHSGFYDINPDEGLKQLDEVLVDLIKKMKEDP